MNGNYNALKFLCVESESIDDARITFKLLYASAWLLKTFKKSLAKAKSFRKYRFHYAIISRLQHCTDVTNIRLKILTYISLCTLLPYIYLIFVKYHTTRL